MYANSAKGQLNKKAERYDDMKVVRHAEGTQCPLLCHPELVSGSHDPYDMSLRGVENPVAISFGNRNSHNVIFSQPIWYSKLDSHATGGSLGMTCNRGTACLEEVLAC